MELRIWYRRSVPKQCWQGCSGVLRRTSALGEWMCGRSKAMNTPTPSRRGPSSGGMRSEMDLRTCGRRQVPGATCSRRPLLQPWHGLIGSLGWRATQARAAGPVGRVQVRLRQSHWCLLLTPCRPHAPGTTGEKRAGGTAAAPAAGGWTVHRYLGWWSGARAHPPGVGGDQCLQTPKATPCWCVTRGGAFRYWRACGAARGRTADR